MNRINSPIIISVVPTAAPSGATFHTVKLHTKATADNTTVNATSSEAVADSSIDFNISSALRAAADGIVFQPQALSFPVVEYTCYMHEEWLNNGELVKSEPTQVTSGIAYLGGYTDYERITNKLPSGFTRKPLTSLETVAVGDTFLHPDSSTNRSIETPITQEGIQQLQGHTLYAVPQNRNRYQFRFINGLGALESVSIECYADESVNYNIEQFQQTRPESMGGISHTRIEKSLGIEQWKFSTGPLTREWRHWYAHEFLMSKHVWLLAPSLEGRAGVGSWLPVLIIPEETTPLISRAANDLPAIDFTVKMNFQG